MEASQHSLRQVVKVLIENACGQKSENICLPSQLQKPTTNASSLPLTLMTWIHQH
jgi:hypothetical protein